MIFLSSGVAQHRGFFKDEGLDADIVVMGAAPSIAALTNGDIDFTLLTGTVSRSERKIDPAKARSFKRSARALIRASRFIRDHREEAVKVLIAWGKAKPEHAYAAYDATVKVISPDGGVPEDGLKFLVEQAKRDVKMTRDIS